MENEKRLIDANALVKRFYNYYDCVNEFTGKNGYRGDTLMDYEVADMIYDCIENAPTVDAVEVVHGRWDIFDDGFGCELMSCSVCRAEFYDGDNDTVDQLHNYCPNCGAKMDGGNENG